MTKDKTEKNEKKTKAVDSNKIPMINSLKFRIFMTTVVAIVATIMIMLAIVVPSTKARIQDIVQDYMTDMVTLVGENVEYQTQQLGLEGAMDYDVLDGEVGGVGIDGMDSSYAYVVNAEGMMMYHPTQSKVGAPVENDAVKQLLAQMSIGKRSEPGVINYVFKGVNKYAAYYIGEDMDFIVVLTADEDQALASVYSMISRTVLAGIIAFVICGVVSFAVATVIVNPILLTTKRISKISSLDLTASEDPAEIKASKSKSETGLMMRAIDSLNQKLVEVVAEIGNNTEKLSNAAKSMSESAFETTSAVEQVEKAINEISVGATSQAQETQTATENIIIIGDMISATNNEVNVLESNAIKMREAGDTAEGILKNLDEANNQTMEAINTIADQTTVTNESALRIKDATIIISNLAEETNLLSLNASIEAARAGEQGRGFAVVATQIQKLAEQSDQSAKQIEEIVNVLIAESEKSVATMEDVKSVIGKQSTNVQKTNKAFADVKQGIDNSISTVANITAKTKQLDAARVKVVDVVQNLSAIAQENAASSEETSASATEMAAIMNNVAENAKDLDSIAEDLTKNISKFVL